MRVYLDMCCLKRPFDDQTQPRIHLESEAVLALLSAPADKLEFVRSAALSLENDQNPLKHRAARVGRWLAQLPLVDVPDDTLQARTAELIALGFKNFDAFHLACAEFGGTEVFCTCDDRLLSLARRQASLLKVQVANPLELVAEVFP